MCLRRKSKDVHSLQDNRDIIMLVSRIDFINCPKKYNRLQIDGWNLYYIGTDYIQMRIDKFVYINSIYRSHFSDEDNVFN